MKNFVVTQSVDRSIQTARIGQIKTFCLRYIDVWCGTFSGPTSYHQTESVRVQKLFIYDNMILICYIIQIIKCQSKFQNVIFIVFEKPIITSNPLSTIHLSIPVFGDSSSRRTFIVTIL